MKSKRLFAKAMKLGFKKRLHAQGRRNDSLPGFVRMLSRGKIEPVHGSRIWRRQKLRV